MLNLKKQVLFGSALLAISASSQAASTLLPNGDFENGGADWGNFADWGGGSTISFETAGGNGGGFGLASNTGGGWGGGFVAEDLATAGLCTGAGGGASTCGYALADYGLGGATDITVTWDMKDFDGDGSGVTGIKMESWSATNYISDTGDIDFTATGTGWESYSYNYTLAAGATHIKIVLVGTNAGEVGFDNLALETPAAVPVPAAAWLFGSALLGLGLARRK